MIDLFTARRVVVSVVVSIFETPDVAEFDKDDSAISRSRCTEVHL